MALDLKLVVEAQKEAYEKAEVVKRLREKMAKKEAAGSIRSCFAGRSDSSSEDNSLSQTDYQRLCGDETGILVQSVSSKKPSLDSLTTSL